MRMILGALLILLVINWGRMPEIMDNTNKVIHEMWVYYYPDIRKSFIK